MERQSTGISVTLPHIGSSMDKTSVTLLQRVKDPGDAQAWEEFFKLYYPLVMKYARIRGLRTSDAEEVAQECMRSLATHMPHFEYSTSRGRFRNYLSTMVHNKIYDLLRRKHPPTAGGAALDQVPAPEETEAMWDQVWLWEHLTYCIDRMESRCADHTMRAFRLYVLEGRPVEEVCQTLDLSANQVYLAKTRMIQRLRTEVRELVGNVLD